MKSITVYICVINVYRILLYNDIISATSTRCELYCLFNSPNRKSRENTVRLRTIDPPWGESTGDQWSRPTRDQQHGGFSTKCSTGPPNTSVLTVRIANIPSDWMTFVRLRYLLTRYHKCVIEGNPEWINVSVLFQQKIWTNTSKCKHIRMFLQLSGPNDFCILMNYFNVGTWLLFNLWRHRIGNL